MAKIQQQKITPFLWFDDQAQEAAEFYCSLFKNSKILSTSEMTVEFELEGLSFMGLNGGPNFQFTEAISFFVLCKNQVEVDHFWSGLTSNGGQESQCGWLKDRFGLSWKNVPQRIMEMMQTGTPAQTKRVMEVMMPMKKMIIAEFERAFNH